MSLREIEERLKDGFKNLDLGFGQWINSCSSDAFRVVGVFDQTSLKQREYEFKFHQELFLVSVNGVLYYDKASCRVCSSISE